MRIHDTGVELDKLGLHHIVHTSRETIIVRTSTFQRTLLLEIVETYVIGVVCTATTQINIVVLTCTSLKHLLEPISIGIVHEMVLAIRS